MLGFSTSFIFPLLSQREGICAMAGPPGPAVGTERGREVVGMPAGTNRPWLRTVERVVRLVAALVDAVARLLSALHVR